MPFRHIDGKHGRNDCRRQKRDASSLLNHLTYRKLGQDSDH